MRDGIIGKIPHPAGNVQRNATVLPGATLTVEPGAVVKFAPGAGLIVDDAATLRGLATADDPIVFTVLADDTGGRRCRSSSCHHL